MNSGSGGAVLAADDISSVFYQRVKVTWGADGTANDTAAASGKGLPIQGEAAHDAASTGNPVLLGAEFDDTLPDSVDEGDVGKLRISANRNLMVTLRDAAGNERGLNVDASGQIAITHAALTELGTAIDTEVQCDIVGALPAGTNAIGKLAANSGVDIGDVDVTTIIPGTGATNLGKAVDAVAGATDTGITVLAVRDDALGGLTPIEGDYVTLLVDANGALWTHDDALDAALSGSELQVDVVAALPAGTNAIGKLAANSGVDIGDVDVTTVIPGTGATQLGKAVDSAAGATDTGVAILARRDDALGALTPIEDDYVTLRVDANGALWTHDDALDAALSGSELQVDVVAALPAGTNAIGKLAANSGVDIGDVDVTSISAGSNLIGNVGIGVRTSGGSTIFRSLDIDETEEEIKATAGQVYWIHAMNLVSTKRYLKFYNATAADVTVGTTTPVMTFALPTTGDTNGAGFVFAIPMGIVFGTAITVACTTGLADNDVGAPGANDVIVHVGYN